MMTSLKHVFAGALMAAVAALSAGSVAAAEAEPTAFDPIAHQRVVEVSEQLRCLVCQNQSIAESNAELAVDLRNQVIEQVKAGKTNKEIIDFMVERYGDFVLYKPPFKMTTAILWLGPLALFVIGVGAFYVNLRRRKRLVEEAVKPLSKEEQALASDLLSGRKE
ncbi:cytochrome c-type biogenesis protein [Sutterella megalosphaeroides]|uniref:Cytochrome c-type biogenesis protein n=1 Tax=Sutterella megalosphaeroides TaxID=2494234 RepID=A0A2Z6IB48_9BURK|nr:cytochrome c-type biogenesis protein [Sutterella megalosphaeroides]BBF23689.1 cystathionine gamma-synthase [Sutterella megalosphaeroides]